MKRYESKELLDNILKEGHITILSEELKISISEYFDKMYAINMKNLYDNSPTFFAELKKNDVVGKYYKKFILLCSLLDFSKVDLSETFFRQWQQAHHDENVRVFLEGPKTNSKMKFDFIKYYNSVISPSIDSPTEYHQNNILKNHSNLLLDINSSALSIRDVVERLPRETDAYEVFIDTSKITHKFILEGNFMIDCGEIDIGEVQSGLSMIPIKKFEYLFNNFNRLSLKMRVHKNLYKRPLDSFKRCFVVFDGVNVFTRTSYNEPSDYFRIGGRFVSKGDWYEFVNDFENVIFRTSSSNDFKMSDVNRFRIYILGDSQKIELKNSRTIRIEKIFNRISENVAKNGFVNVSDTFLFDTFNNTLSDIDPRRINRDFSEIYYWKTFIDPDMDLFDIGFKRYSLKFSKIELTRLSEWFIKRIVHNICVVIDNFTELPKYELLGKSVKINGEEFKLPFFWKGFKFEIVNDSLKIEPPEEFEEDGVKYRRLRFSNRDFEECEKIDFEGVRLENVDSNEIKPFSQKIDIFGNGRIAAKIVDEDSVIFCKDELFMRSSEKDIYYSYGKSSFNVGDELLRDSKEIELAMTFT